MDYKIKKQYRHLWHDYASDGYYFVTIGTKNKTHFFGRVEGAQVVLSEIGKIAQRCWLELPQKFSNVRLDEWIIMPNHVHAIVVIDYPKNAPRRVPTTTISRNNITIRPLQKGSLSSVVNHYKGHVKKECNKILYYFEWQTRFYDSIIRSNRALNEIQHYIKQNPTNWESDRNNLENLFM